VATKNLQVKIKRSLTHRCDSPITVRTDLQNVGLYLIKHWLLRFMCEYEQGEKAIEFSNLGQEFVAFIAKNQFKQALIKHSPEAKQIALNESVCKYA
jgi:hypothetical protein